MTHYERSSPIATQNAQAIEEFLLAEQAKGSEGCSRMEIEIATGLLHNQWDKAKEQLGTRLVGFGSVPKLYKYRIEVEA